MHAVIDPADPAKFLTAIAACLIALGVMWRYLVRPPFRFFKRMENALLTVEKELKPNGGKSLRDAIDRVEHQNEEAMHRLEALEAWRNNVDPQEPAA